MGAGEGEAAPVGYQVLINYVMRVPGGQEFANTVADSSPQDVRVGTGNLIEGDGRGPEGHEDGGDPAPLRPRGARLREGPSRRARARAGAAEIGPGHRPRAPVHPGPLGLLEKNRKPYFCPK